MLFLTIPIALALLALAAMTVIVWRKMPFLRKLTPESHEVGDTWLHDMAPEAIGWFRSVPWRQSMHNVLVEFEKFLRRMRLMMSALDRASDRLVRNVRRVHEQTAKQVQQAQEAKEEKVQAQQELQERDADELDLDDPDQLRQEEQRLIIAIAQSPKDPALYSEIARVYMRLKAYGDAAEALAQAVKLDPENESYQRRLESARRRLAIQTPAV